MDIVFVLMTIVIFLLLIGIYLKNHNKICMSKRRLDGKTCLVTGGTSGIGLEVAIDFASRGARVIVACPFKEEGISAEKKIIEDSGNKNVVFKLLDLASLRSVREFAKDILETEERLDILMNNAGVGAPEKLTEDGIDCIMQINYFGPFLLTILLLPLLKKSGSESSPSRIVNTSSWFNPLARLNLDSYNKTRSNMYVRVLVYADSKLSLVLFSRELSKRLSGKNVVINSVDPGAVGTRIFYSGNYFYGFLISNLLAILSRTPWEGAQNLIYTAVDEKAGCVSGKFFSNCQLSTTSKSAYDDVMAKKLFEKSVELVKLTDEELLKGIN